MKLRVKRLFKYMVDNVTADRLLPGEYNVPGEVSEQTALKAIQLGAAVWITTPIRVPSKKVAPENKAVKVPENKADKRYKDKGLHKSPKKKANRKQ
jgi:hypothetical protein